MTKKGIKPDVSKFQESKFGILCVNNKYVLLSFLTSAIISILVAYCYSMWPFGDVSILRMDLYHQYGPLFGELYDRLTHLDFSTYSWESSGGGLWLGNFFNYLSSPLSFLVLLFGHKNIPIFMGFLIFLKGSLASATFTYYLKNSKQFLMHNPLSAGLGLCYGFCAWFVAYYWNVMWLDGLFLLPLIVLGVEALVEDKKPWLFVISLALVMFSSYYMAYMTAIFCVLYYIMFYIGKYEFKGTDFLKKALRCFLYALISLGLAACAFLPLYFTLKGTYATSGSFPEKVNTYFKLYDFIANHFTSLEPTIRSSGDLVMPNVYCGVLTILLTVLYFYIPSISLKEKVTRLVAICFMYLSFNVNMLNYIWHGFHFPNDLPFRQSFMYVFLLLYIAATTLKHIKELSGRDLLTTTIITALFLVFAEEIGQENLSVGSVVLSLIFLGFYAAILSLFHNKQYKDTAVAALLFVCIFAEVTVSDITHFEIDQPITNYAGKYTEMQECIDLIDQQEEEENYRMEITYPTRIMEPCWYGYNGISCFSSMASEKVSNLQYNMGLRSNYVNSFTYHLQTPVYNMMFGLKYLVNNDTSIENNPNYFDEIGHTGSMEVWKNKYALPLCYAVNQKVTDWNFYDSNPFVSQNDFVEKATGVKNVLVNVPVTSFSYDNVADIKQDPQEGSYIVHKEDGSSDGSFTAHVTLPETKNYYLYVSGRCVETATIKNRDESYSKSQDVGEPYILDLGIQKKGDSLSIELPLKDEDGTVEIYLAYTDGATFTKAYNQLNDTGAMELNTWKDTKVSGTVTLEENELLFTSINYDSGWKIEVDGKAVSEDDIVKLGDALIGIKMAAGTHDVSFRYEAPGFLLGLLLSFTALLVLLFLAFVLPRCKNDAPKRMPKEPKEKAPRGAKGRKKQRKAKNQPSMSKTRRTALEEGFVPPKNPLE